MSQNITYIVAYAGPSGAGKTVMADMMVDFDKQFYKLHQMTTRDPRHNKDEYVFVPPLVLETFKENGLITCYTHFNNNHYGTLIEKVPFKFLEAVVSAEGMTSLYADIEKFEALLGTKVEILPVLISYSVSEEALAARKRNRSVEFVQNELDALAKMALDIPGFKWFLEIDNSDGYTTVEEFSRIFNEALDLTDTSGLKTYISEQLSTGGVSAETLMKIKLLLAESQIGNINEELSEFAPLVEEKPMQDAISEVIKAESTQEVLAPVEEVLDPATTSEVVAEPEKKALIPEIDLPDDRHSLISDDDDTDELDMSAFNAAKAQQDEATAEAAKPHEYDTLSGLGFKRVQRMCKQGFVDFLSETGRTRSTILLNSTEMENAMINFLLQTANLERAELDAANAITVSIIDGAPGNANAGIVNYAFTAKINDQDFPIFTMKFDKEFKQIS